VPLQDNFPVEPRLERNVASFSGLFAVFLGALGSHAFRGRLDSLGTLSLWQTAAFYHLTHSIVLLVLSSWQHVPRLAYQLVFWGMLIFSGSLYLLALSNARWLGAITPLGGLGMIFGWLALTKWRGGG
jgi:uncharacterized membrane protein YgdD (TMEM256/DUF423 family)